MEDQSLSLVWQKKLHGGNIYTCIQTVAMQVLEILKYFFHLYFSIFCIQTVVMQVLELKDISFTFSTK